MDNAQYVFCVFLQCQCPEHAREAKETRKTTHEYKYMLLASGIYMQFAEEHFCILYTASDHSIGPTRSVCDG